jgi:pimeloyl-ACP methyl ester carboxylesterase
MSATVVDDGGPGGIPVVFLHSLAGRASHWSAQLTHLRHTRRALALELPGHGSAPPALDGDYSIEAMGRAVSAALTPLRLGHVVIAGHSFGGGVALEYASTHPADIAGLLLLDPISDGRQVPAAEVEPFVAALESSAYSETIEEYWTAISGPNGPTRQRLLDDLRQTPRDVVLRGFRAMLSYNPVARLERFNRPAISIVTPQNDGPTSLHRLGRGLPSRVVKGTGHWIQIDRPELVNRIMDQWLETTDRAEGD